MVNRFPQILAFVFAGLFFLVSGAAANTLSRAQAIKLADAEAHKQFGDLRRFLHDPVFHETGCWYVGYRQPGRKFVDFGIHVYDKTKKAWVLMP